MLKDGNASRITYIAVHGKSAEESLRVGQQVRGRLVVFSQRSSKASETNTKLINSTIADQNLLKSIFDWIASLKIQEPQPQDSIWELNPDQSGNPSSSSSRPNSVKSDESGFSWDL
jgi:hypothetical protein